MKDLTLYTDQTTLYIVVCTTIVAKGTRLMPSYFFQDESEQNKMIRVYGDGTITYGIWITTTLACMMDFHYTDKLAQ
jgi:hypothetical protein